MPYTFAAPCLCSHLICAPFAQDRTTTNITRHDKYYAYFDLLPSPTTNLHAHSSHSPRILHFFTSVAFSTSSQRICNPPARDRANINKVGNLRYSAHLVLPPVPPASLDVNPPLLFYILHGVASFRSFVQLQSVHLLLVCTIRFYHKQIRTRRLMFSRCVLRTP